MKIGFIGTGNMAEAMIGGYLQSKKEKQLGDESFTADEKQARETSEVVISGRNQAKNKALAEKWGVFICKDNQETVRKSDVLVIAVKPNVYPKVLHEIKDVLDDKKIIVSIAAGVTISNLESQLGSGRKIVRTMPNTPSMVGEGITAVCPNSNMSDEDVAVVLEILTSIGKAEIISESLMDAVVGVSGSAPAYVFMFIEAMADGAVARGMPRAQAYRFAAQTVLGAAKMVLQTGKHPGELKDMVCSPGGATIDAVCALEKNGFRNAVISAVGTAANKSKEMAKN